MRGSHLAVTREKKDNPQLNSTPVFSVSLDYMAALFSPVDAATFQQRRSSERKEDWLPEIHNISLLFSVNDVEIKILLM